ncbi:MAG: carboxypeptidase-like regulatory domain-containing protein, partial [Chloroflexota bacterium]
IDMLKENGKREDGAHCTLFFADRTVALTIDKPANEAGTNAPMFRGNFYDVEGADGLPSDKAVHFNTEWPDEEGGNTNGHHSFMVIFQKTIAAGAPTTGAIRGTVINGAGRSITLSGGGVNVTAQIGTDSAFGFDNVAAGTYTLAVVGTTIMATVVVSAGQTNTVTLNVPLTGGGDLAALQSQVTALQTQMAQLQQQLAQISADRDRLNALVAQIKQVLQNAGL